MLKSTESLSSKPNKSWHFLCQSEPQVELEGRGIIVCQNVLKHILVLELLI